MLEPPCPWRANALSGAFKITRRQHLGMARHFFEHAPQHALALVNHADDTMMAINALVQEMLEVADESNDYWSWLRDPDWATADVVDAAEHLLDRLAGCLEHLHLGNDGLGGVLVVPEAFSAHLRFEFFSLGLFAGEVKESPGSQ